MLYVAFASHSCTAGHNATRVISSFSNAILGCNQIELKHIVCHTFGRERDLKMDDKIGGPSPQNAEPQTAYGVVLRCRNKHEHLSNKTAHTHRENRFLNYEGSPTFPQNLVNFSSQTAEITSQCFDPPSVSFAFSLLPAS